MKWFRLLFLFAITSLTFLGCSRHNQDKEKQEQLSMSWNSSTNEATEVPDQWDFYICKVDDEAASISLNFWYRNEGPINSADNLYWCQIGMLEPGDHGMGVGNDAKVLQEIEDAISEKAQQAGFYYVGRLRNHGRWQLVFYGSESLESTLRGIVTDVIPESSGREYVIGSKPDSDWTYYIEFLCPDAERWQWIMDRRVIDNLRSEGDSLTQPRRVDHWVYFGSAVRRDGFVANVLKQGFQLEQAVDDGEDERPFLAHIFREDSVQLEDIHGVVMSLIQAADKLGGEYDGWETSIKKP